MDICIRAGHDTLCFLYSRLRAECIIDTGWPYRHGGQVQIAVQLPEKASPPTWDWVPPRPTLPRRQAPPPGNSTATDRACVGARSFPLPRKGLPASLAWVMLIGAGCPSIWGGSSASPSSRQANCDGRLAASTTTGSLARARDGRTALLVLIQGGFQVRYAGSSSSGRPLGYRLITPVGAAVLPCVTR